ncbi:MAG: hypothetical protein Q4C60_09605 [Eubacteriales bacterium]|nr:hypothetical protein [Eubacteriales bacterium]
MRGWNTLFTVMAGTAAAGAVLLWSRRQCQKVQDKAQQEIERLRGELIEHYADNEEDIEALQTNVELIMETLDLTH